MANRKRAFSRTETLATVKVRRGLSIWDRLIASGLSLNVDASAVVALPLIAGKRVERVELLGFQPQLGKKTVTEWQIPRLLRNRRLRLDVEAVIDFYAADLERTETHPATLAWKRRGQWISIGFRKNEGRPTVFVLNSDGQSEVCGRVCGVKAK